ncbi:MAG: diguanylate cyclase [Chroococcidiopsidaceae cyanobacterium CP_BM_ER_R8_30]|nr:diguanylate cyclase [Chroococcidiopsidaceae cyanobacterium CP_BM_ER_R8_30]
MKVEPEEQNIRELVDSLDAIVWEAKLPTFQFTFVSRRVPEILGYPVEQWLKEPDFWVNLIPLEERQQFLDWCWKMLNKGNEHDFEQRFLAADGQIVWLHTWISVVRNEQGDAEQLRGLMVDVTERKRIEELLRQQAERERLMRVVTQQIRRSLNLDEILNTTVVEVQQCLQADRVVVFRYKSDGKSVVVAESVATGWNPILGMAAYENWFKEGISPYTLINPIVIHDIQQRVLPSQVIEFVERQQVKSALAAPIFLDNNLLLGALAVHQCSGLRQWQPFEVELLEQVAIQLAIAIQQSTLYQQLEQANLELQRQAIIDSLTQVANRRRFDEYLDREWRRLAREQAPLSLILCDLDFFKLYNDTYGHQAGDKCLQQIAQALELSVRRPTDLVARYGGEEFAIILPDTDDAGAVCVAERIRSEVKSLAIAHANSQHVTISLGIASALPCLGASIEKLIAAADRALYQAKEQGRDHTIVGSIHQEGNYSMTLAQERNLLTNPLDVPTAILQRRAIKSFKSDPIPDELLKRLVELTVAAPSSWNLQDWRIVLVRDEAQRAALAEAAFGQQQILQAPVTFVFAADALAWQEDRSTIYNQALQNGAWTEGTVDYFKTAVPQFQTALQEKNREYAVKDAAIAATHLLLAAESLGLSTCPMNGWIEDKVKEVIGAAGQPNLAIAMLVAVGYEMERRLNPGRLPFAHNVFVDKLSQPYTG